MRGDPPVLWNAQVGWYIPQGDISMLTRVGILRWVATMIIALFVAGTASASGSPLTKLAAAKFPNLTRCERAVLENADINTTKHGPPAACGPSSNLEDPSNDPKNAATWDHQRDLRAELIRWVFVDPDANKQVDPVGIQALGARITGSLDLGYAHAPFVLGCVHCAIPEPMTVEGAELNILVLSGSYTNSIDGAGSHIHNGVFLNDGFKASGQVFFGNSRIDSDFNCSGGSFTHSAQQGAEFWASERPALFLGVARIQGPVWLSGGFKADGAVDINGITCDGVLCSGGRFVNPGNRAIFAWGANISGAVILAGSGPLGAIEATGLVQFDNAKIGGVIYASGAKFLGSPSEIHGFSANAMTSAGSFVWQNITLQNGATLDLRSASVNGLIDDQASWPAPGRLAIDGFVYHDFYGGPVDAASRLKWVSLGAGQHPPWLVVASGFHSQPYRELAKVLRDRGDDAGAARVMVAQEDARYSQYGTFGRSVGGFIKWTIGYGHRPLLAIGWSLAVILLGWGAVSIGARAGVMAPTWPENKPPDARKSYEELHPPALLARRVPAFREFTSGTLLVARRDGDRRICRARPRHHDSRTGVALLPMAADRRRMAAERDLHRRHHWPSEKRLIAPDDGGSHPGHVSNFLLRAAARVPARPGGGPRLLSR